MNDQPLFAAVLENFERRCKAIRESQNRSLAQRARHAKAALRKLAKRLRREGGE